MNRPFLMVVFDLFRKDKVETEADSLLFFWAILVGLLSLVALGFLVAWMVSN
jgi:hypothetical protein